MKPHVFGVRHLSPMGAFQLRRFLDEHRPRCVLIEGPADCTPLIGQLVAADVTPPVAVLAYTAQVPVRSLTLPLADYSPEYQAMAWARANGAACRFIDLPTELAIPARDGEAEEGEDAGEARQAFSRFQAGLYDAVARLGGWDSHDSWWEATFEHNPSPDAYRQGVAEFSAQMRSMTEERERAEHPAASRYNALREAHMRREMARAAEEGYAPHELVVVCGAYHVMGLLSDTPPLSDDALAALPRRETKTTLMPYSYYKLSSQSGYGAGNMAPAYFEGLWQCLLAGRAGRAPAVYLAALGQAMREQGHIPSTASVIEAVRLAGAMAALRGSPAPILSDLHQAAVACLGHGELSSIAMALATVDVGTAIGQLPEGVSQTPIQDDFNRHLRQLKLERYKSTVAQDLELDLRENRRVQSEAAAFLDLDRSTFLNRLAALHVPFAMPADTRQQKATWYEKWALRWTPEAEIALVESTLLGETLEVAVSYALRERLELCGDVLSAAGLIKTACICRLPGTFRDALSALQALSVDAGNIQEVAGAAHELSLLISYGDVRRFDTAPLIPLLAQLFLRGCLLLTGSSACDDKAAPAVLEAMGLLHSISQEHYDHVDDAQWLARLGELAFRDDRNPRLSGAAFAILLERGEVAEPAYGTEVSRRLSPGIPAEVGAGWFEGLAGRNRYALLSRTALWRELNSYIASLDEQAFTRSVVFLRRAFSAFEPGEKNSAIELLAGLWGVDSQDLAEGLLAPLAEDEAAALAALDDFDFEGL